jgi:hypothetical protein
MATTPIAQAMRPGMRRRRGSRRSPKRPAHQRTNVAEAPSRSRAVAAEKNPGPGAARGRKVMRTPEAAVLHVKSTKILSSAGRPKRIRRPAPSRFSLSSGEDTPRAAREASRGAEAPIRKTRA